MINHKNEFITWYFNNFIIDELYVEMQRMCENSPWHREGNVGIHTNMVVSQYLSRANHPTWMNSYNDSTGRGFLLGAFAAAFHDTGKPGAVQYKHNEERGNYKAFAGHEKLSARIWEDWAVKNWNMLESRFMFIPKDMYVVGWMIEHHLPWGLKHKDKLRNLSLTTIKNDIVRPFTCLLMADTTGRISDDADTKYFNSANWVEKFEERTNDIYYDEDIDLGANLDTPRLIMPIAPSGSGKSTWIDEQRKNSDFYFSWDKERVLFAMQVMDYNDMTHAEIYKVAWQYCTDNEKEFRAYWQKEFIDMVKKGVSIYVDNTNLTKKVRRFFLDQAKRHGYWTEAVLMPITRDTVFTRQTTRDDKNVPVSSVKKQYDALQLPWYGEFDEITVIPPPL